MLGHLPNLIEEMRTSFSAHAPVLLTDLCDISGPTIIEGGAAGDSVTIGPLASNVSCDYRELGQSVEREVGGETYIANHRLRFPRDSVTTGLTPKHIIKLQPRGNTGQLVFAHPFIVEQSKGLFLEVDALLIAQGYR